MRISLDTNVLAYAEGVNGPDRQQAALVLIGALRQAQLVVPVQVLGELYNVLVRKDGQPRLIARQTVSEWARSAILAPTREITLEQALVISSDHGLAVWDAIILAASAEAGCELLLSEDMHDGFIWDGTTVVNPFAAQPHDRLTAAPRQ